MLEGMHNKLKIRRTCVHIHMNVCTFMYMHVLERPHYYIHVSELSL